MSQLAAAYRRPPHVTDERSVPVPRSLLAGSRHGQAELVTSLAGAIASARSAGRTGPMPPGTPSEVLAAATGALGAEGIPDDGIGADAALRRVATALVEFGLDLSDPRAAAHLQPPPLSVAVAADALASAGNASLDTYDSGPATIAMERWVLRGLTRLARLGQRADGVLTPGGSMSNLLGLLLARDAAAMARGIDTRRDGVAGLTGPVVFCSAAAHFSTHRACAALGLGEHAVRTVASDHRHRMNPEALAEAIAELDETSMPVAIVATAGTTDFGTIDPLPQLGEIAAEHGIWLHVDAAYGFGALFSDRLSGLLDGVELADSVTVDLHKIGWQPAAASALLVADTGAFGALDRTVAYLNPADDGAAGYEGLLGRSLQTTRRPDAVKIAATMLAHGRAGLGRMVDVCHDLAGYAQRRMAAEPELELVAPAELTTVVFRYVGSEGDPGRLDATNAELRRMLLEAGEALIGRTAVGIPGPDDPERTCVKLTLLNPAATSDDVDGLIDRVLLAGRTCARPSEEDVA